MVDHEPDRSESVETRKVESTTGKLRDGLTRNSKLRLSKKNNFKTKMFKPFSEFAQLSPFKAKKSKNDHELPVTLGNLYRDEFEKDSILVEVAETNSVMGDTNKYATASDSSFTNDLKYNSDEEVDEVKPYEKSLNKIKSANQYQNQKQPFNARLSVFRARSNGKIVSDKCDAEWSNFLAKLDRILDNRVGEFV